MPLREPPFFAVPGLSLLRLGSCLPLRLKHGEEVVSLLFSRECKLGRSNPDARLVSRHSDEDDSSIPRFRVVLTVDSNRSTWFSSDSQCLSGHG